MKKANVLIAALAAAALAVNSGYADIRAYAKTASSSETAVRTETEKASSFEGEKTIKTNFKVCRVMLVSDDGQVYYTGNNRDRRITIFSADYEGNIVNSLEIKSELSDKNGEFDAYGDTMKQIGDYFYFFYRSTPHIDLNFPEDGSWVSTDPAVFTPYYSTPKSFKCVKLDKELNVVDEYELKEYTNNDVFIDVNSTKLCYVKAREKIYLANHDGSGKKLIYTVGDDKKGIEYIDYVAMNDDYIAFVGTKSSGTTQTVKNSNGTTLYMYDPDLKYCGIIDLKTGEIKTEQKDMVSRPTADDNGIIWQHNSEEPWSDKGAGAVYSFGGEKFTSIKTKTAFESYINQVDSDGKIITYHPNTKTLRVYENGRCVNEIDTDGDDMGGFTAFRANNGVAAISYSDAKNPAITRTKLIAY